MGGVKEREITAERKDTPQGWERQGTSQTPMDQVCLLAKKAKAFIAALKKNKDSKEMYINNLVRKMWNGVIELLFDSCLTVSVEGEFIKE